MIFKCRLGSWRITFTIAPVTDVKGVNSLLNDGNHIVMWDFDDIPLEVVEAQLLLVQILYDLPNIYILNTGKPNHYIAYSFARVDWQLSKEIVASTPSVDTNFFKYGVYREKWTLRVTPKEGRKPKLVKILYTPTKDEVNISELNSWVKDTLRRALFQALFLPLAKRVFWERHGSSGLTSIISAQNMRRLLMPRQ